MCRECGCGVHDQTGVEVTTHGHSHAHAHSHSHEHDHTHSHEHEHEHQHEHDHDHDHDQHHPDDHHARDHSHPHQHEHDHEHEHQHAESQLAEASRRTIEVRQAILAKNDRLAERNRGFFHARDLLALNVLSSPGSGKTTFLQATIKAIAPKLKAGVIVGDLATDNDARRLRDSGAPVAQITTGTVCHLEAEMVARALKDLNPKDLDLLIIENVGNLVCPASYDLGEDLRVVLVSVTEGEDKPLKYPPMFQAANVVIISKIDLAKACGFDRQALLANLRRVAPAARVFETSAKTGEGMKEWCDYLLERKKEARDN